MDLIKLETGNRCLQKMNQSYFYDKVYFSLIEDGINIKYGDFCSRVLKNGMIKVLKSLGLYSTNGARNGKAVFAHKKLKLIIDSTIEDNSIVAKTIIDLVAGKYNNLPKFNVLDISNFMALDNDYPHSIDNSKCTYIIYNKYNGLYKIGRSSDIGSRLNCLRKEFNQDLYLVAYLSLDKEGELHKEYIDKRSFGEWFNLSSDDILDISNKYKFTIVRLVS